MKRDLGIYIHIPFCIKKCYYCDFNSFPKIKESIIENYINALCNEIIDSSEILSISNIKSIYFGGGTPSYIDSKYITQILNTLKMVTNIDNGISITIEINPKTLTLKKATDYIKAGINRASIGLQSTYDTIIKQIGRAHTYQDFKDTLEMLKLVGITNISCDLMYPLPSLTVDMFKETLNTIVNNEDIKHISIYNLEVYKDSKLSFLLDEGYLTLCNEDDEYKMRNMINDILIKHDYINYEISNYAKQGFESTHNLLYWNGNEYLGFGVSSSSFINNTRITKIDDLNMYIDCFKDLENLYSNNINIISDTQDLTLEDLKKEYMILKLRLKDGVNVNDYFNRFKSDVLTDFKEAILDNVGKGLIIHDKLTNTIYLTSRGKEIANLVWQSFM